MIELKIKISDIDYNSVAALIAEQITDPNSAEDLPGWAKLLFLANGVNEDSVKKIMSRFTKEKKDDFAINYLNRHKEDAIKMLEEAAEGKGIKIRIWDIEAEKR